MRLDNEKQRKLIFQLLEATTGSNKPENIKAMYDFVLSLEKAEITEKKKEDV